MSEGNLGIKKNRSMLSLNNSEYNHDQQRPGSQAIESSDYENT